MNQAHSTSYNTREGVLMPATARRKMQFCEHVSTPERATDSKLKPNRAAVAAVADALNLTTPRLIQAAKNVLVQCKLSSLIVVDSRESAIAVLYGINQR